MAWSFRGSSPLTRGKLSQRNLSDLEAGLIPAHAGKTRCYKIFAGDTVAHPRSRGENERARQDAGIPWWLIPAHAGKTVGRGRGRAERGAHPRSRGENGARRLSGRG